MVVKECRTTMLIKDMDISRLMTYLQQIDEENLKERSREANKEKKTVVVIFTFKV